METDWEERRETWRKRNLWGAHCVATLLEVENLLGESRSWERKFRELREAVRERDEAEIARDSALDASENGYNDDYPPEMPQAERHQKWNAALDRAGEAQARYLRALEGVADGS